MIDLVTAASEQPSSCMLHCDHLVDAALLLDQLFHLGDNRFRTDDNGFAGELENPGKE